LAVGQGARLLALLDVRRDEVVLVVRLLVLYFVLIAAVVLIQSMAFGLFLAEYGSGSLPYAYLVIAAVGSLVAVGYLRLGARVSFSRLLTVNLSFLALGSLGLWLALGTLHGRWAVFLLPVWFQLFVTLVNLAVWPLALRLFDMRQGKRLFGLIGAGNWLANALGGLVVAPLVALVGPAQLLLLAAFVVVAAWLLLQGILREHVPPTVPSVAGPARRGTSSRAQPGPYAWRIFGYVAVWWLAFYFVDNVFYAQAAGQFPDAEQLTAFIGRFLSITGIVALITTVALTSRILKRFGLATGLLTMPVLVAAAIGAVAAGGALGLPALALFYLATAGKLFNVGLGFSLSQTAHNVMYQALPDASRERVQTTAEGMVQPLAVGTAGAALLLLTAWAGLDSIGLAWVLAAIAVVWIVLARGVGRAYPGTLAQALARRRWGGDGAAALEPTALALLKRQLDDPYPGAVVYALEHLAPEAELVHEDLARLLNHPAPEVRETILRRLEARADATAVPVLERRVALETVPAVKAAALRALAACGGAASNPTLTAALDDPDPAVRSGSLVGLLRHGGEEGAATARQALGRLAVSATAGDRVLAAEVLGAVGPAHGSPSLLAFLTDEARPVRVAALLAAASVRPDDLWSGVVGAADAPGCAAAAERALVAGGEASLEAMESIVAGGSASAQALVVVARACGRIGGTRAVRLLEALREARVGAVRRAALEALTVAGYRATDAGAITIALGACRERMTWLDQTRALVGGRLTARLLTAGLEDAWQLERDQMLLLLSHVGDAPSILDARAAFARAEPSGLARALEVIETRLPARLRRMVVPWLEASPGTAAVPARGAEGVAGDLLTERLVALIDGPEATYHGPWVRACAIHAAGVLPVQGARAAIGAATRAPEPVVAETAAWARARLAGETREGTADMLSILERVLILKDVPIFADSPDPVLADVATLLDEVDAAPGEAIVRQGEQGDSLYVVVDGRVSVLDGSREIDTLGDREVFGEMSLLDPEPRVATVTAREPTRLLRLPRGQFIELVHERPEVAVAIMRVLVRRLRARIRDLGEFEAAAASDAEPRR
jgi:HEAT repeat protein